MHQKLIALAAVLAMGFSFATASADTFWGCTNGTDDLGFWSGGEIFTVDTETGATNVVWKYTALEGIKGFGDIAQTANGDLYVTYYGDDGFDKLARVNRATGAFDHVWDLGGWNDQVNALHAVGNSLYGITGGGLDADHTQLRKYVFDGDELVNAPLDIENFFAGMSASDGDLTEIDGLWVASFCPANKSLLYGDIYWQSSEVNIDGSPGSYGIAGLEYDSWGRLYAGSYNNKTLYEVAFDGDAYLYGLYDLNIGGGITGLEAASALTVPAPGAGLLLGIGLGLVGITRRIRRKK